MAATFGSLGEARAWFGAWLADQALPLWADAGRDAVRGGYHEALARDGGPTPGPRRARVQARQVWVYATAAAAGLGEAYARHARRGYEAYRAGYLRADGLFGRAADPDAGLTDPTPALYEQAFSLLAMAALETLWPGEFAGDADALLAALSRLRHPAAGFVETGAQPHQANAQMHLLEAALAWEEALEGRGGGTWARLADEIAGLALARFIDPRTGALREFFDGGWRALPDEAGGLIEPGHQFEWAWLLDRWGCARAREDARRAARRLHAAGLKGVDRGWNVAMNALWSSLEPRDRGTRLWAQTEYLKAALRFGDAEEARRAAEGLRLYLAAPRPGAWRDKLRPDRCWVDEPSPATSLYHLVGAILCLSAC